MQLLCLLPHVVLCVLLSCCTFCFFPRKESAECRMSTSFACQSWCGQPEQATQGLFPSTSLTAKPSRQIDAQFVSMIVRDHGKVVQLTDTKTVTYNKSMPALDVNFSSKEYNANNGLWLCYASALAYQVPDIIETVVRQIWGWLPEHIHLRYHNKNDVQGGPIWISCWMRTRTQLVSVCVTARL